MKGLSVSASLVAICLLAAAACLVIAPFGRTARAESRVYPGLIGKDSDAYTVTVDGQDVPVHTIDKKGAGLMARIAFDGETTVTIAVKEGPIVGYRVRPWWAKVSSRVEDGNLKITFTGPQDLFLQINRAPPLNLLTYPLFEAPSGDDVHDAAKEFGLDSSGKTDTSADLQKAVDKVAEAGGGTVFLPDGVYGGAEDAEVALKSNVTLHLAPGAILKQTRLTATDVENVTFSGHGILEFTGSPRGNQAGCLRAIGVKNLEIRDLISTNFDYNWNTRFDFCEDVKVRRYRVYGGKDGIDPVDSQRVSIRDVQIVTSDDCIATKSFRHRRERKPVEDIVAENCMLKCTRYGGVKIGTETNAPAFRNIVYRNVDVVGAMRAAIIQLRDGAEIHDITIENLTCDYGWQRPIDFVIQKRNGLGTIHDVTVRNVHIRKIGREPPRMEGYDEEHKISDVTFENLYMLGEPVDSAEESHFNMKHTKDIRFVLTGTVDRRIPDLGRYVKERSEGWDKDRVGNLFDGDLSRDSKSGGQHDADLWVTFDFGKAREIAGVQVYGDDKGGTGGMTVEIADGDEWKPIATHARCYGDLLHEIRLDEPVTTDRLRLTLHGLPRNSYNWIREFWVLEPVPVK